MDAFLTQPNDCFNNKYGRILVRKSHKKQECFSRNVLDICSLLNAPEKLVEMKEPCFYGSVK